MSIEKDMLRCTLLKNQHRFYRKDSQRVCERAYAEIDWTTIQTVLLYQPLKPEIDPQRLHALLRQRGISVDIVPMSKYAEWPNTFYDCIVIPIIGYNIENFRIGRGGGWYDILLARQPQALSIGLAHYDTKVVFTPEPHDIPLTHIFTV